MKDRDYRIIKIIFLHKVTFTDRNFRQMSPISLNRTSVINSVKHARTILLFENITEVKIQGVNS